MSRPKRGNPVKGEEEAEEVEAEPVVEEQEPVQDEETVPAAPELIAKTAAEEEEDSAAAAAVAAAAAASVVATNNDHLAVATAAAVAASEQAASSTTTSAALLSSLAPTDRDVILGEGSAGHKTNLLLQDVIRLHRILWKLHDKPLPTTADQVHGMAEHIVKIIKRGKQLELAGLKDVPKPFMKSQGRFFAKDSVSGAWKTLQDDEIKTIMTDIILEEFKVDDLGSMTVSPYKDLKEWISKSSGVSATAEFLPEPKDAILMQVQNVEEKMFESQQGNKTLFHLASQLVTSQTNAPDKRVEAALYIMKGLDETIESMESNSSGKEHGSTTKTARFLIRNVREDRSTGWELMDAARAAEFTVIFVFEVFLEKEIIITDPTTAMFASLGEFGGDDDENGKASTVPVLDPTEHDVLFGRGGMTNSHTGNRRFRDIIALHRPDYIRAIKLDKPGVARKIVKAIRQGNPPGRFLKKADDGLFYDVGDRTAAEKTSQGLRERTNAEKRQRSALREALRIRKQDMVEDDEAAEGDAAKRTKTDGGSVAATATLNYVGTNVPVPLSLNMKDASVKPVVTKEKKNKLDSSADELNCEGLPPNAVDEEGNILVTDYDILCGRGGLTNHHKGNKRFRDIVALHRPDYIRAPKIQKPSVARVIVRAIRNGDPPGRFLRKDERLGKWMDIGDKKASEKTSQALREKINEDTPGPKAPLGSGVLLPNPASYLADALSGSTSATPATKTETTEDGAYTTMTVEESKAETLVNDVSTVVKEQV